MIVFGLSISRKEAKKIHSFLNNQKGFSIDFESDINDVSWTHSENIIMRRVEKLEQKLYHNTVKLNKNFDVVGDIGFYFLPYIELLIKNFSHIKFICTRRSKKNTYNDIMLDVKTNNSVFSRLFLFKKKYKNHWTNHNGKKWERDYLLDKCYPTFSFNDLNDSIYKYIEIYNSELKILEKKYPKNLQLLYSDEINSEYGKDKVLSFIGINKK